MAKRSASTAFIMPLAALSDNPDLDCVVTSQQNFVKSFFLALVVSVCERAMNARIYL